ncbi:hypothetical protein ACLOJK_031301 [Asimina triloba]
MAAPPCSMRPPHRVVRPAHQQRLLHLPMADRSATPTLPFDTANDACFPITPTLHHEPARSRRPFRPSADPPMSAMPRSSGINAGQLTADPASSTRTSTHRSPPG